MKQPIHPKQLLNTFLQFNLTSIECTDIQRQPYNLEKPRRKIQLKRQIQALEDAKKQYLNFLQLKKRLSDQLKELLNRRQSLDFDQRHKKQQFSHQLFPYRSQVFIKQQLNQMRIINSVKRRKILKAEQQVKKQQEKLDKKRRELEHTRLSSAIGLSGSKNNDCVDDFWIKRVEKIKKYFLNKTQQNRRDKIKHDYNLLAEKANCDCTIGKVCPICSNYNIFEAKSTSYARQALLSPRYTSIYRSNGNGG